MGSRFASGAISVRSPTRTAIASPFVISAPVLSTRRHAIVTLLTACLLNWDSLAQASFGRADISLCFQRVALGRSVRNEERTVERKPRWLLTVVHESWSLC